MPATTRDRAHLHQLQQVVKQLVVVRLLQHLHGVASHLGMGQGEAAKCFQAGGRWPAGALCATILHGMRGDACAAGHLTAAWSPPAHTTTTATTHPPAHLLIHKVGGQQLQSIGHPDGRPLRRQLSRLPRLAGVAPVHALEELGEGAGLGRERVAEAPQQRLVVGAQRPAGVG